MKLTKMLHAPAVATSAVLLVLSTGGIALASSGALEVPFTGHDNRSEHAPAAPAATNPGLAKAGAVADPNDDATEAPEPGETDEATPTPSFKGLCNAYQHGAFQHGKSKAFAALVSAAGGNEGVGAFCTSLIGQPKPHPAKPTQAAQPTHPAKPSRPAKPSQAATPEIPEHPAPSH